MPGFDGTGPMGHGPLTGRGMGYCAVPAGQAPAGLPAGTAGWSYPVVAGRPAPAFGFRPGLSPVWRGTFLGRAGRGFRGFGMRGRAGGRGRRFW
ncbi:MAG: hypothetical protein DRH70_03345 [Candidatus Coatesbacteria bacterium]|nr:MAG: hypothetical protein DRH70_03345 [Candidatus Coatesbacteria bacterium]